jgi:DNA-3-methyladenine glycosylase II
MKRALETCGRPEPRGRAPGYATLLRTIVDQQVSVQSGAAIWRRLEEGIAEITPEGIIKAGDDTLRACGLSRPKARYARCLADAIVEGSLDLDSLNSLSDAEVMKALTAVIGIGRWTAEIYLMFALGREDVWPGGDVALAASAERLMELEKRPSIDELDQIAERWRPWRTTAAVMLWHYYKRAPLG